jgi:hypothetical protein
MPRRVIFAVIGVMSAACATPPGPSPAPSPSPVPDVRPGAITAGELRQDVYAFAADSFLGREAGTPNEMRAARFIATRLASLGLEPAGDSLYYHRVPLVREIFGAATQIGVTQGTTTTPLSIGKDVVPWINLGSGIPTPKRSASGEIFFAGYGLVSQGRNDFQRITQPGLVIVMLHGAPPGVDSATREELESQVELGNRIGRAIQFQPAAIVLLMTGKTTEFYNQMVPYLTRLVVQSPGDQTTSDAQRPVPMIVLGVAKPGSPLLPARFPSDETPQLLGDRVFNARLHVQKTAFTSYNVAAVVRGTDARMNKSYVAFGAHYDHVGIQTGMTPDSIANGADDDASGSMTLLAVAKAMKAAPPRRSILFVWHGAEEKGLLGSAYFTSQPTVPIDSIVAQINSDMIGRRGGPSTSFNSAIDGDAAANRLYVIGPGAAPNNQSRVLGAILDSVNARQPRPLEIDRSFDSPTHPERHFERSDHYNYSQQGIPVVMLTTGTHEDYHKVSDEAAKIDFEKMARIGALMLDFGTTVANRERRPR